MCQSLGDDCTFAILHCRLLKNYINSNLFFQPSMIFQQIWPMIYVDPIIVWLETNWDLILEIESMLGCQLGTHQQC